jgi:hypothetical protein
MVIILSALFMCILGMEAKGQQVFSLATHVIPLTQLKSRQDTLEISLSANSQQIDGSYYVLPFDYKCV